MGSWKKAAGNSPEDRLDETAAFITAATPAHRAPVPSSWPPPTKRIPPARTKPAWPANPNCRRNDKVAGWLDAAEKSWLKDVANHATIERYTFSSYVLPLAGNDWRKVLAHQQQPRRQFHRPRPPPSIAPPSKPPNNPWTPWS